MAQLARSCLRADSIVRPQPVCRVANESVTRITSGSCSSISSSPYVLFINKYTNRTTCAALIVAIVNINSSTCMAAASDSPRAVEVVCFNNPSCTGLLERTAVLLLPIPI